MKLVASALIARGNGALGTYCQTQSHFASCVMYILNTKEVLGNANQLEKPCSKHDTSTEKH